MMQPQTLPISINSAGPAAAAARGQSGNVASDNTQFGQTLSREIEQRQQARNNAPAQTPQQQAKPAQAQAGRNESKAPAKAAERSAKQDSAEASAPAETQAASRGEPAEADEATAGAVESAAVTPVTDMLALAASLAAPAAVIPAASETPAGLPAGVTADPAAAGAALAAALAPAVAVAVTRAEAPNFTPSPAPAPAAGLAAAQSTTTQDIAGQELAPEADGMFADALSHAAQANRAQQGANGAQMGAGQQQDGAALPVALAERVADTAAAAPSPVPETTFVSQVQAARLEQVQANPLAAGDRLPARVGTPGWDKQLGQKIVWMVAGTDQSATLTLNPPDLGPMQVVLNVTNDQATVNFTSAQPEVRQALENAMPKLREMMGESGITLGSATVNAGMPEQQQQAQRGNDARHGSGGGNGRGSHDGAGSEGNAPAAPVRRAALPGQVDTFA